jgi:hypothetical protein
MRVITLPLPYLDMEFSRFAAPNFKRLAPLAKLKTIFGEYTCLPTFFRDDKFHQMFE